MPDRNLAFRWRFELPRVQRSLSPFYTLTLERPLSSQLSDRHSRSKFGKLKHWPFGHIVGLGKAERENFLGYTDSVF